MANPASILLDQASTLLQDTAKVRWPDAELIDWLNEGIKTICAANPTAYSEPQTVNLVAGTRQELPENGVLLIDMHRNIDSGYAIRLVDRVVMDAAFPEWPTMREEKNVQHFMYDKTTPNTLLVYPPNTGEGSVEMIVAMIPPLITTSIDELPLRVHFNPPLLDFIMYRAYTKDAEYAANAATAAAHFEQFSRAIGPTQEAA
jgi:hypothetical protein